MQQHANNSIATAIAPRRITVLILTILYALCFAVGCANDITGRFRLEPGSQARFSTHGSRTSIHLTNEGPAALHALITQPDDAVENTITGDTITMTIEPGAEITRIGRRHLAIIIRTVGDRATTLSYHIHGSENAFAEYDGVQFTDPYSQMEDFEHAVDDEADASVNSGENNK